MSRLPQHYRKLLHDPQALRSFFLKPAGLEVPVWLIHVDSKGWSAT